MVKTKQQLQADLKAIQTKIARIEAKEELEKNKVTSKIVKLSIGTYEVETKIHHLGKTYAECEKDCPKDWEIATNTILQELRNLDFQNGTNEFNLIDSWEFVQQPDLIAKKNNYVVRFCADSYFSGLGTYYDSSGSVSSLGVRYVRKISEKKNGR